MKSNTRNDIMTVSKTLFATHGYEGFSMRTLADVSSIGTSSIYHFFKDKDVLLSTIFTQTCCHLGDERAELPKDRTFSDLMYDRIVYQFKHIEDITFILKYFFHFKAQFQKQLVGFLPKEAYIHISEVLEVGIASGGLCMRPKNIDENAKFIAHAINGYLMEYFPDPPSSTEMKLVISQIHSFIMRGLGLPSGGAHELAAI